MILPIRTFPRPFTIEQKDTAQRKPRITIVWWYKWEMLATRLKSSVQEAHFTTQFRCSNRGCKVQHISWRAVMSHSVQCTMILLASCMRTKETELNCSQIWDFLLCALIFARLAPTASQSPSTQLQFSGVHMLPCSGMGCIMGTLYCHMQGETKHRLLRVPQHFDCAKANGTLLAYLMALTSKSYSTTYRTWETKSNCKKNLDFCLLSCNYLQSFKW